MPDEHRHSDVVDLREYLVVLRRRRWTILLTFVVIVGAALGITSRQTPIYESSARIVLENVTGSANQILAASIFDLETQRELLRSVPIAEVAAEELGGDVDTESLLSRISVSSPGNARVIVITARHSDAQMAADTAQAFADAYLRFRREDALERLLAAEEELRTRTADVRARLAQLEASAQPPPPDPLDPTPPLPTLDPAAEVERQSLLTQLGQLSAQQALIDARDSFISGGGQVLQPARVPTTPVEPRPVRAGIFAGILGLMLGIGLAFVRDFADDTVKSEQEVARATGAPILGHIPIYRDAVKGTLKPVSLADPSHAAAEAYRTLRTNLHFLSVDEPLKTLLITSAQVGEGKSTTAVNLASSAAMAGRRVVLVDADLRRPTVHRALGLQNDVGLTDVLIGQVSLEDALKTVGSVKVLPAGKLPPNPAELLSSTRMSELIDKLQHQSNASLVVFDGAPVLAVADALALSPQVDAVLLVAKFGETSRHRLRVASSRLANVGARVVGTVLNLVDPSDAGYYHYYYADSYDEYVPKPTEQPAANGGPRRRRSRKPHALDEPVATVPDQEASEPLRFVNPQPEPSVPHLTPEEDAADPDLVWYDAPPEAEESGPAPTRPVPEPAPYADEPAPRSAVEYDGAAWPDEPAPRSAVEYDEAAWPDEPVPRPAVEYDEAVWPDESAPDADEPAPRSATEDDEVARPDEPAPYADEPASTPAVPEPERVPWPEATEAELAAWYEDPDPVEGRREESSDEADPPRDPETGRFLPQDEEHGAAPRPEPRPTVDELFRGRGPGAGA